MSLLHNIHHQIESGGTLSNPLQPSPPHISGMKQRMEERGHLVDNAQPRDILLHCITRDCNHSQPTVLDIREFHPPSPILIRRVQAQGIESVIPQRVVPTDIVVVVPLRMGTNDPKHVHRHGDTEAGSLEVRADVTHAAI